MELAISLFFTIIAVVTAGLAIPYFLYRRWKYEEYLKQTARDIPHVDSKWCKCYWCGLDRAMNEAENEDDETKGNLT